MKRIIYIISLFILTVGISAPVFAGDAGNFSMPTSSSDLPENRMDLDIYINGIDKIQLENIPIEGYLEAYSILGVKVTSINLKQCVGNCTLSLAKGIYILKVGKVARKIIVK